MNARKFFFLIPHLNIVRTFLAFSAIDARHQLMSSFWAPYYAQAVLLNGDD